MKRFLLVIVAFVATLALSGCGIEEGRDTERGRGDTSVSHINQGGMDLSVEMGDGFLNYGIKCVGPTAIGTSTKGNGGAGGPVQQSFMDPFCLGVYNYDGSVNNEQLNRYVQYMAELQAGNGEKAAALAKDLISFAPKERTAPDHLLR